MRCFGISSVTELPEFEKNSSDAIPNADNELTLERLIEENERADAEDRAAADGAATENLETENAAQTAETDDTDNAAQTEGTDSAEAQTEETMQNTEDATDGAENGNAAENSGE